LRPGEVFGIDGTAILTAIYEDELVEEPERREIIISNLERQKELLLINILGLQSMSGLGIAAGLAPGHLSITNSVPATTSSSGNIAALTGLPASQFALGQEAKNLSWLKSSTNPRLGKFFHG